MKCASFLTEGGNLPSPFLEFNTFSISTMPAKPCHTSSSDALQIFAQFAVLVKHPLSSKIIPFIRFEPLNKNSSCTWYEGTLFFGKRDNSFFFFDNLLLLHY